MRILAKSLTETEAAAIKFLNSLEPNSGRATVVGLVGDLGSGKTTFVQALARQLGVRGSVTSPTFVIEKIYLLSRGESSGHEDSPRGWRRLAHIDAYRFAKPEELSRLRFSELLAASETLVVIEWAERVESLLPADSARINFKFIDENTREISFT